jgi:hypothetical protein
MAFDASRETRDEIRGEIDAQVALSPTTDVAKTWTILGDGHPGRD